MALPSKKRSQAGEADANKVRAVEGTAGEASKARPAAAADVKGEDAGMDVDTAEMGEFEDPFEDEFESDEDVIDGDDENMQYVDDDDDDEDGEGDDQCANGGKKDNVRVYLPGQPLAEDEELQVDNSAYEMLHALNVKWPCLSFDILHDQLGVDRTKFPHTAYIVAGSQADVADKNELYVMKMSQLCKTKYDDDEISGNESDDDLEDDPILEHKTVPVKGGVNRVRVLPASAAADASGHAPHLVASWSELGHVNVHDLSTHVRALDTPGVVVAPEMNNALHQVKHSTEGFALAWAPRAGSGGYQLLSGDGSGSIQLTVAGAAGFSSGFRVQGAHASSVEDLAWSPSEPTVFASCSADGTVKIFDTRMGATPGISARVAKCDVNVISWNALTPFLLASGHDDGGFAVWDLREFARSADKRNVCAEPAAQFAWHRAPITSIEWHSHEESMLAVAGDDNQVTLWDFSTERDDEENGMEVDGIAVPPQLLFIHQGQEFVKEVHWHKQIPGCLVSTAASGFNVFKTINS